MKNTYYNVTKELEEKRSEFSSEFFENERKRALQAIHNHTKRNTVLYYSQELSINDFDVDGFIDACGELTGDKLDLILHSEGGYPVDTENIVEYLRGNFSSVRVIVPRTAMSAATLLACSGDEIVMATHSCLGPTDPQVQKSKSPHGAKPMSAKIIRDRMKWFWEVAEHADKMKFIRHNGDEYIDVGKAIELNELLVEKWLQQYMFKDDETESEKCRAIGAWLSHSDTHKSHGRPLHRDELREKGLRITDLEQDPVFYDLVMKAHYVARFESFHFDAAKIICSDYGGQYTIFLEPEEEDAKNKLDDIVDDVDFDEQIDEEDNDTA